MTDATLSSLHAASASARAPGKVNIHLSVGGLDDSGYHRLANLFQALDVYETVTVTPAPEYSVTLDGRFAGPEVPRDETNLALAAVIALNERLGRHFPVAVHIDKQVPVAGGMGGGSADAAAALLAHAELVGGVKSDLLMDVAAGIGADVPFALHGGTALGVGRGDELSAVLTRGELHWVLATSTGGLSTPAVYRHLDRMRAEGRVPEVDEPAVPTEVVAALAAGDAHRLAGAMENDLAAAACDLLPAVGQVMDTGMQAGALRAMVSGSGPTVAFLAADARHALDIAVLLEASPEVRHVVRTTGPVRGAHLVTPVPH